MKIDTALYNNEKRHLYFIVDTILSRDLASAFRGLCVSYAPAYTVDIFQHRYIAGGLGTLLPDGHKTPSGGREGYRAWEQRNNGRLRNTSHLERQCR
jgi:hypothetical protein